MSNPTDRPFSRRYGDPLARIRDDFSEDGRIALGHVLATLVRERYVSNWNGVVRELARLARRPSSEFEDCGGDDLQRRAEILLSEIPWQKVFDFCERIYSTLAIATERVDNGGYSTEEMSRADVQVEIAKELKNLFDEENFDYEFVDGRVIRATTTHTANLSERANVALGDGRLREARVHYGKAQRFFNDAHLPDYSNAVKEAVCAVESAAKVLLPFDGSTLGELLSKAKKDGPLPATIVKCFEGLYAFRNSAEGVSHGGATGGKVSRPLAEFSLASAASQIILLVEIDAEDMKDIPF